MSKPSSKIPLPEGEEMQLFIDDVTNRILERYMPAREIRGLPTCDDSTMIRGIVSITINRLIRECGTIT